MKFTLLSLRLGAAICFCIVNINAQTNCCCNNTVLESINSSTTSTIPLIRTFEVVNDLYGIGSSLGNTKIVSKWPTNALTYSETNAVGIGVDFMLYKKQKTVPYAQIDSGFFNVLGGIDLITNCFPNNILCSQAKC